MTEQNETAKKAKDELGDDEASILGFVRSQPAPRTADELVRLYGTEKDTKLLPDLGESKLRGILESLVGAGELKEVGEVGDEKVPALEAKAS